MKRRLVLRPQAELEIAEAGEWYESRARGLGAAFVRAVDAGASAIHRNPHQFPRVHGELRRALLRRFPYGIIYSVSDEEIVLLGCLHARRDPKGWQGRG